MVSAGWAPWDFGDFHHIRFGSKQRRSYTPGIPIKDKNENDTKCFTIRFKVEIFLTTSTIYFA